MDRTAAVEKSLHAERAGSIVRVAVVVFGAVAYHFFVPKTGHMVPLAYGLAFVGIVYSVYVHVARPFERHPALAVSRFVTLADAALIAVFIAATGGISSPFFLLWYVEIVGVAFRYDFRKTMVTSLIHVGLYFAVLTWEGTLVTHFSDALLRGGFIVLVAAEAGLLSQEAYRQTEAKVESLRQLRAAHEALQARDAVLRQVFNNVSHELGTPLTPVRLQLHLLRSGALGPLDARQQRAADIMHRNLEQVTTLAQDAVDVARMQAGRLRVDRQDVDLTRLLTDARDSFLESARASGVEVGVDALPVVRVRADPRRVNQVILNLLANALRFTPSGGRITLRAAAEDGEALVSVHDTGAGIDSADLSKLFQPFSQAHAGGGPKGGTGLGLFISRGIVEEHGGRIWAQSAGPGRGATFAFTLPAA